MRPALSVLGVATLLSSPAAHAQLDVGKLVRALDAAGNRPALPGVFDNTSSDRISLLAERIGPGFTLPGYTEIAGGIGTVQLTLDELVSIAENQPGWRLEWSPPRRLLLDRARGFIRADTFAARTGKTGRGVIVGIVDSGLDVSHPDLRDAEDKTRVVRLLDFSREPLGAQPDLEQKYGCVERNDCAILSGTDIDALLANDIADDEPRDDVGHGTHVASLAAGAGRSDARFAGVAPEASLIVARVTRVGATVSEPDIVRATAFIFEEAESLGVPAVVNLSLGSDFGAHDGSSMLERALADLVGPEFPGRAIVVAAGNSAGVVTRQFEGYPARYPEPLGIHTQVHVPRSTSVRVPILSPATGGATTRASVFVWVQFDPGDRVSVGFDNAEGNFIEPLAPGAAAAYENNGMTVAIYNGVNDEAGRFPVQRHAAVVVLDGRWASGSAFALRLEGQGTAQLWLQSEGDLGPAAGNIGALFPSATKEGTINIPASHPELIAVGATINRTEWTDYTGSAVRMPQHGSLEDAPPDTLAYFSSAGPNALGMMKPDVVAPGVFVTGAMAEEADPRDGAGSGLFSGSGRCASDGVECFVVDDEHAIATGTSMAAPLVSGAIALLLEQDPLLTQPMLQLLLRAGVRRPEGIVLVEQQRGPGALSLDGIADARAGATQPRTNAPSSVQSWISLAASFARPDGRSPLVGLVHLRDEAGGITDGPPEQSLHLEAAPAIVDMPLSRLAPGLFQFVIHAPDGSGQEQLTIRARLGERLLLERSIPIAVDESVKRGSAAARGGCSVVQGRARNPARASIALGWAMLLVARRRRSSR